MRTVQLNELLSQSIYLNCRNKVAYENGKATERLESTNIELRSKDGEFQIVLPPDTDKCEYFNNHYSFGDKVVVEELVEVKDIRVTIYKDSLLVKVLAEYKKED